jgi:hypothetical protein
MSLLEKFQKMKNESLKIVQQENVLSSPKDLFTIKNNNNSNNSNSEQTTNYVEHIFNPVIINPLSTSNEISIHHINSDIISEKLNHFRHIIQRKEVEKINFEENSKLFFDFFEQKFTEFYTFKDISEIKEKINFIENCIQNNKHILFEKNSPDKNRLLTSLNDLFLKFEENFTHKINQDEDKQSIEKLKNVSTVIKNYAKLKVGKDGNFTMENDIQLKSNLLQITNRTAKKRNKLLESVYIQKSRNRTSIGEDDEIIQTNIKESDKKKYKPTKNRKLLLKNFLQIYVVKEGDILSQSFYSKYDRTVLYSYRHYKFYEIKICLSNQESVEDITEYLSYIKTNLIPKYLIVFRTKQMGNFTKISISGVGNKQSTVRKGINTLITGIIKRDCLIKCSLFSNVFDCISGSIKRCFNPHYSEKYCYHYNFEPGLMKKLMKKCGQFNKKINPSIIAS